MQSTHVRDIANRDDPVKVDALGVRFAGLVVASHVSKKYGLHQEAVRMLWLFTESSALHSISIIVKK